MNNEEMCYITYVVPKSKLMPLLAEGSAEKREEEIYPSGFVPEWFLNGRFPEDE